MKVFVSYRRDDSIVAAKLVHDELARQFGAAQVFMDIEDIGYGDDFVAAIAHRLGDADVVLVVIGPRWLEMLRSRGRGDDWVHAEVAQALAAHEARGRPRVIGVLVGGAAEPPADALPDDLRALARSNLLRLDEHALKASLNTLAEAVQGATFSALAREGDAELVRRRRAQWAGALIGMAAFIAGWTALFDLIGLDTRVATATMAIAAALPGAPTAWKAAVVLAAIDERTEAAVGRPFGSTWRAEHGAFIRRAADAGARTVAFDITFAGSGPQDADAAFAAALADVRGRMPVVVGVQDFDGDAARIEPALAGAVRWGIACAGQRLGVARAMPLLVQRQAGAGARAFAFPSLALAAFAGAGRVQPLRPELQRVVVLPARDGDELRSVAFHDLATVGQPQPGCEAIRPGDRVASQLFDPFALPPLRDPPQRVAYEDVLRGEPRALQALAGRIVLVGVLRAGEDLVSTGPGGVRWGAELIAAQIDTMARGVAVRPLPWVAQWLLTTALALVGAVAAVRLRLRAPALRIGALTALALAFVGGAVWWYRSEQQLLGVPYGVAALALGAFAAGRFTPRSQP